MHPQIQITRSSRCASRCSHSRTTLLAIAMATLTVISIATSSLTAGEVAAIGTVLPSDDFSDSDDGTAIVQVGALPADPAARSARSCQSASEVVLVGGHEPSCGFSEPDCGFSEPSCGISGCSGECGAGCGATCSSGGCQQGRNSAAGNTCNCGRLRCRLRNRLRNRLGGLIFGGTGRLAGHGMCHCWCLYRYPPPGDMVGHFPYHTWRTYYYFRPYQARHVDELRGELNWPEVEVGLAFSNEMFRELHAAHAEQIQEANHLEFADRRQPAAPVEFIRESRRPNERNRWQAEETLSLPESGLYDDDPYRDRDVSELFGGDAN